MSPATRPWSAREPEVDLDVTSPPPRLDRDEPRLQSAVLRGLRLTPDEEFERLELEDVVVEECDVAGLIAEDGRATRMRISRTRLRALTWIRATLNDIVVEEGSGSDVTLRFATLRRVVLRDLDLAGIDLTNVTFDRVLLARCDLRGARFDHCQVKALRIEGCNLAGATGVTALRGASIHPDDVASMAIALAGEVGIVVAEESNA